MAIDDKYGHIYREADVRAMLQQAGCTSTLEDIVAGLTARGHDFKFEPDEPVVVVRARDAVLPRLLEAYYSLCVEAGSPRKHLDLIKSTHAKVVAWQRTNRIKTPASASYRPGR